MTVTGPGPGRAGRRDRHDRRRPQHGGQGARGPRLLRRRQPAAEPAARRGPAGRREPRHRAADRGRRRRPLRARSSRRCRPTSPRAPPAGTPRCSSSRPPTTCSSAARRPPAARTRCRAAAGCSTGCDREREVLGDLRGDADLVIDTTNLNVHQLTDRIAEAFGTPDATRLQGHGGQLRLQVRHPGRRRLRRRHAVPAQPALGPRAAPAHRPRPPTSPTTCKSQPGAAEFLDGYVPVLEGVAEGYLARGQALHDGRHRLHRRQAPQRRDDRGDRPPARPSAGTTSAPPTATWGASDA